MSAYAQGHDIEAMTMANFSKASADLYSGSSSYTRWGRRPACHALKSAGARPATRVQPDEPKAHDLSITNHALLEPR